MVGVVGVVGVDDDGEDENDDEDVQANINVEEPQPRLHEPS